MSAVRAVLKSEPAEPSPAADSGAGAPAPKDGSGTPDPANTTTQTDNTNRELTEADFTDVEKPSVKKRIDQLLAQKGALRAELENLRETAGHWAQHVAFYQEHNATPQDMQNVYGLVRAFGSGDFATFVNGIRPYYELALRQMGEIIPEDLQRRVDQGDLTSEDAREISTARARASNSEAQRVVSEQRHEQASTNQRMGAVRDALDQWEQGVAQRDPEYALKRDAVMRYAMAMRAERGLPYDPTIAVQWANEALASVNKLFTSARPTPQPTQQRPSSAATSTTRARPEPKSMLDAARFALEQMRA